MGLLIGSMAMSSCGQTNTKNSPEERAKLLTQWMKENLQLTDAQMEKASAINLEYAQKMETLKSIDSKLGRFRKFKELSSEKDSCLKNLLTTEQYSLYQEKKQELRSELRERYKQKAQ